MILATFLGLSPAFEIEGGSRSRKPIEIKRGNVTVKIYTGKNRANGVSYNQCTLDYHERALRRKMNLCDLDEPRREGVLAGTREMDNASSDLAWLR